jgi:DNA-binding protein HU-beta
MTKKELIALVAEDAGISREVAEKALNAFVTIIGKEIRTEGRLALAKFGTFVVRQRKPSEGKTQTASPFKIPTTKAVKFEPHSQLDKIVNFHVHIHAPVGFLQVGDGSIANVKQSIDSETREQLTNVLEEISSKLTKLDSTMPITKEEIIELVQDGKGELKKPSPNMYRLGGIFVGLATAIQTISSLKPAYLTLKHALSCIGIPLP